MSVYIQPPRSTQPGHSSVGRCNEYQPKCILFHAGLTSVTYIVVHVCLKPWFRMKYNYFEIILKLFHCFISDVTNWNKSLKSFQNYFSRWKSFKIISKLFLRHWTCRNIFSSCNKSLKQFWNNFRQVSTRWNKIISERRRRKLK